MTQIELDIRDWRVATHLSKDLWADYVHGNLEVRVTDLLERHLLACPGCQEELLEFQCGRESVVARHAA